MSLRRPIPDGVLRRYREPIEFGLVYLALATLPLLDVVAPRLAYRAGSALPAGLPGIAVLTRAWFWVLLGMVVVGVAYAVARGVAVPTGLPSRTDREIVGIAVLGPVAGALALALVVHAGLGSTVADVASLFATPDLTPGFLWWNAVLPGLLVGLGYGVLFCGAFQEHLRSLLGPGDAAIAVAVLAAVYHWVVDPVWGLARSNLLLLVPLVLTVAAALAAVELSRMDEETSLTAALTPTRVAVFALAGLLAFAVAVDVLSGATTGGELLLGVLWAVVFGVAAWSFERTRSVWTPVVTVAVFQTAIFLLPHLEAAAGLTAGAP